MCNSTRNKLGSNSLSNWVMNTIVLLFYFTESKTRLFLNDMNEMRILIKINSHRELLVIIDVKRRHYWRIITL